MPRRFFRKLAPKRDLLRNRWFLAPFAHLLHDTNLWGIRRRSVVPAFSVGLFVSFLPFPGHPLVAALAALFFRVNIPVAAITTFVSNPLTIGPMYYLAYRVGHLLLGTEPRPFAFELSIEWVTTSFVSHWPPLMLGCVLLGALASLAGYAVLDLMWRLSLADYLSQRRLRRNDRSSKEARNGSA